MLQRVHVFLLFLALLSTGCAGVQRRPFADNVKFIGVQEDVSPGRSIGGFDQNRCRWGLFNIIPLGAEPTFEDLKNQIKVKTGARYLTGVSSSNYRVSFFIFHKDCLEMKGEAYK